MGGHIKVDLEEFNFQIPSNFSFPDDGNDIIISLSFKSKKFKVHSPDDLFLANWVVKTNRSVILFKIFQTTVNIKGDVICEVRKRDAIIIYDDSFDDTESGEMEAFFCFPPCPTCMMFMKLYPECSRVVKGIIL